MSLPVVKVNETEKLIKLWKNGSPFYITNSDKKLLVYDPNLKSCRGNYTSIRKSRKLQGMPYRIRILAGGLNATLEINHVAKDDIQNIKAYLKAKAH